jgi:hypothetical protein
LAIKATTAGFNPVKIIFNKLGEGLSLACYNIVFIHIIALNPYQTLQKTSKTQKRGEEKSSPLFLTFCLINYCKYRS